MGPFDEECPRCKRHSSQREAPQADEHNGVDQRETLSPEVRDRIAKAFAEDAAQATLSAASKQTKAKRSSFVSEASCLVLLVLLGLVVTLWLLSHPYLEAFF